MVKDLHNLHQPPPTSTTARKETDALHYHRKL